MQKFASNFTEVQHTFGPSWFTGIYFGATIFHMKENTFRYIIYRDFIS